MTAVRPIRGSVPRRNRLRLRQLVLAVSVALLAGCGGSDPSYYTLTAVPGQARPGVPLIVELRTPSIAPYLDRDTVVRSEQDNRLELADGSNWAGALPDMIGRNLALDLGQRLPGSTVYLQGGAISTTPMARIELDVSHFARDASGRAEIEATLTVHRPGSEPIASGGLHLTLRPADPSVGALVGALSVLLGQVADSAADALLSQ